MPLLVPCDELRDGMRLFEPIISNGRVMLQGGKALSSRDIEALRRRYPGLCVRIGDPLLDDVIDFEDDSRERDAAAKAQQTISKSMSEVRERFSERASLGAADFAALHEAVNELMEYLKGNPVSAALITNCLDNDSYLATHTGNVFYLSMLLGSTVLDYVASERSRQTSARGLDPTLAQDLTPLGLGAMAMDLGMLPLQDLYRHNKPLTESQIEQIHKHPSLGADLLPGNFPSAARMIVRTHHENYDGTGYPKRMQGDKIHVLTRIVRIADAYDAAISDRVYKQAKSPARALWEMTKGPYRRYYDPHLTDAFAKLIQPFPIGSKLRLEDGRYAVVTKYNRKSPFQPTVAIAFDEQNQPIDGEELQETIDLASHPELRIKSFRGEDLAFIHETQPSEDATPRESFRSLFEAAYP